MKLTDLIKNPSTVGGLHKVLILNHFQGEASERIPIRDERQHRKYSNPSPHRADVAQQPSTVGELHKALILNHFQGEASERIPIRDERQHRKYSKSRPYATLR